MCIIGNTWFIVDDTLCSWHARFRLRVSVVCNGEELVVTTALCTLWIRVMRSTTPGADMTEDIISVIRRYQDEIADVPYVPTGETSNLCLAHHQQWELVTCNHRLHVFHGLLCSW